MKSSYWEFLQAWDGAKAMSILEAYTGSEQRCPFLTQG